MYSGISHSLVEEFFHEWNSLENSRGRGWRLVNESAFLEVISDF